MREITFVCPNHKILFIFRAPQVGARLTLNEFFSKKSLPKMFFLSPSYPPCPPSLPQAGEKGGINCILWPAAAAAGHKMLSFPPFPSGERGAGGIGGVKRLLLAILLGDHGSLGTSSPFAGHEKTPFYLGLLVLLVGIAISPGRFHSIDETAMYTSALNLITSGSPQTNQLGHNLWTPLAGESVSALAADGTVYTKKSPLIVLLLIPLVALGRAIPAVGTVRAALWLGPLVTAATAMLLYALARRLGYRRRTAFVTGLIFSFATQALPYMQTAYGEPVAALGLLLAMYGLSIERNLRASEGAQIPQFFFWSNAALISGLGIALAIGANIIYALLLPVFAGAWLLKGWKKLSWQEQGLQLAALGCFPALMGAGLLGYNAVRFGSIWETGYHFAGGAEGFTTPLLWGIAGLTLSPARGFFWYNPPALLALPGWFLLRRREHSLSMVLLLVNGICVTAFGGWWEWWGGWTWGPRFLLPLIPYAMIAALPVIERLWPEGQPFGRPHRATPTVIILVLTGLAVQIAGAGVDFTRYENELTACCTAPADQTLRYHHKAALVYDMTRSPILAHWKMLLAGQNQWAPDARPTPRLNQIPAVIESRRQAGDAVVYLAPELENELLDRPTWPPVYGLPIQVSQDDPRARVIWDQLRQKARRLWVITWYAPGDTNNWYEMELHRDWAQISDESLDGMRLLLFARPPEMPEWRESGAQFGPLRLLNYRQQISDGTLFVEVRWQADSIPPEDYTAFIHLLKTEGPLLAQQDRAPWGGYRSTGQWQPGEPVEERYAFPIGNQPAAGVKTAVGWYSWPSLERLPVSNAGTAAVQDNSLILP